LSFGSLPPALMELSTLCIIFPGTTIQNRSPGLYSKGIILKHSLLRILKSRCEKKVMHNSLHEYGDECSGGAEIAEIAKAEQAKKQ
jgi:hypothetical protein